MRLDKDCLMLNQSEITKKMFCKFFMLMSGGDFSRLDCGNIFER